MKGEYWHIRNEQQRANLIREIQDREIGDYGFMAQLSHGQRSIKQNSAIHVYFTILADALNEAGMEIHMEYLGKTCEVPWTPTAVKERLWLPIMQSMFSIKSTAKLDRKQVSEVYEVLSRWLATEKSILIDFPSAR